MSFYSDFAEMLNINLSIYRITESLGPMNQPIKTQDLVGNLKGHLHFNNGSLSDDMPMMNIQSDARIYTGPEIKVMVGDILKDNLTGNKYEIVFVNNMLLNDHIEIDVVFKKEL